jgi:hypothetical protein
MIGTLVSLPTLDDATRRAALSAATEARRIRAAWKARVGAGEVDLAGLLAAADGDRAVAAMRVTEALGALPGVGPRGVARLLEDCDVAPSRRLRGLGPRQRAALLAATVASRRP